MVYNGALIYIKATTKIGLMALVCGKVRHSVKG